MSLSANADETPRDINRELLEYIQSSIIPFVQAIRLQGRGDPLLAKEALLSTLTAAKEFAVPVILETHALDIQDDDLADALLDGTITHFHITLNAPDDEMHRRICGRSQEPAIQFLHRLHTASLKSGRTPPHVSLNMVATCDNIEHLPDMILFAQNHHADELVVTCMSMENDPDKRSAFRYHRDLTEEIMYRSLIEAEMSGFTLKTDPPQVMDAMGSVESIEQFLAGQVAPEPDNDQWTRDCSCLWTHAIIDVDGHLIPCCGSFPPVGNLSTQAFQDVWLSDHVRAIRHNLITGCGSSECSQCRHLMWRKNRSPRTEIQPDDDVYNLFAGWFQPELDERVYRWTKERSVAFLQRQNHHQFLVLQMKKAVLPESANSGKIIINHQDIHPFHLQSTKWETMEIPLPASDEDPLVCVEIIPSVTVRPAEINADQSDHRSVGIKVGRIWLEGWEKKVVFNKQLVLLGYDVSPESWDVGGDVVLRTFWRTLGQMESDVKIHLDLTRDDADKKPEKTGDFGKLRQDQLQLDFLLEYKGLSSSNWPAGAFIAHESILPVPDTMHVGHYRIGLGLYPEGSPKKRLKIVRSDRDHHDNLALLGTVLIAQQKR